MSHDFQIPRGIPIQPGKPVKQQQRTQDANSNRASFQKLLDQQLEASDLKFSAHALKRLAHRGIALSEGQMERLHEAVAKAAGKGGKESLILVDDLAFVVSVRNRTVITALDHEQMADNVFTNIDSAVVSKEVQ